MQQHRPTWYRVLNGTMIRKQVEYQNSSLSAFRIQVQCNQFYQAPDIMPSLKLEVKGRLSFFKLIFSCTEQKVLKTLKEVAIYWKICLLNAVYSRVQYNYHSYSMIKPYERTPCHYWKLSNKTVERRAWWNNTEKKNKIFWTVLEMVIFI